MSPSDEGLMMRISVMDTSQAKAESAFNHANITFHGFSRRKSNAKSRSIVRVLLFSLKLLRWLLAHTPKPLSLATPLPRPQPLARTALLRRRQSLLFVALAHERWANSADCKNCTEPYDSARRSRRSRPTPAVTAYSFFTLKLRNSTGSLCPAKPMWPFVWSSPFGGVLI